jgi:hypothetical protein
VAVEVSVLAEVAGRALVVLAATVVDEATVVVSVSAPVLAVSGRLGVVSAPLVVVVGGSGVVEVTTGSEVVVGSCVVSVVAGISVAVPSSSLHAAADTARTMLQAPTAARRRRTERSIMSATSHHSLTQGDVAK